MRKFPTIPPLAVALVASTILHTATLMLLGDRFGLTWNRHFAGGNAKALNVIALPVIDFRQPASVRSPPSQNPQPKASSAESPPMSEHGNPDSSDTAATSALGWIPYVPAKLLDEKPRVIRDIPPDLPELSSYPQGGEMVMTLKLSPTGSVDLVEVEATDLPEVVVDETARAFFGARFSPGRKNGQAVGALLKIKVRITPLTQP